MSISRQLREAALAAAADPNTPSLHRPGRGRGAAEPQRPLTQAQLGLRLQVVPAAKAVNVEEEQEKGGQGEKRGRAEQPNSGDSSAIEEDVEEDVEEEEEEGAQSEEEADNNDEDDDEDNDEDNDNRDDEVLDPKPLKGKGNKEKRRRKQKNLKQRTKRSLGHFLVVQDVAGMVKCALCTYKPENLRPDNIVRHWKGMHGKSYAAVESANNAAKDVKAVVRTEVAAVSSVKGAMDNYAKKKPRATEQLPKLMKEVALLRWMIVSKVAFNTLDQPAFHDLLTDWGVSLEAKSTMLNLLSPMFEHVVSLRKAALAQCAGIACTFDLWTSCAGRKYLAVTYHGVDRNWQLFHCVLDVVHFHGTTQSELIAAVVESCIEKHLPKDKLVTVVVSDGAGDAKHAREDLLDFDGHDCFNHDLNLCLGDALKLAKGAATDFSSMEYLIREVESDKNLRIFFENMQEIAGFDVAQKFVHRNDTRWTGLGDCLVKFLKMRDSFFVEEGEDARVAILEDWPAELSQDVFQYTFWDQLRGYSDLLLPLNIVAKSAQSLSFPTGSRVPKYISDMRTAWTRTIAKLGNEEVKGFGDALLKCLTKRCNKYLTHPCNTLKAAALDPSQSRFLLDYGVSQEVVDDTWDAIVKEGMDEYRAMQKDGGDGLGLYDGFDDAEEGIVKGQVAALRSFLKKSQVPANSDDPLSFYRTNVFHCTTYAPLACRVATNLLAIPAGEAHSERVWSWAGGFVTKLQNRLADDTLQELIVMYDFFRSDQVSWEEFKQSFARALREATERTAAEHTVAPRK